MFVLSETKQRLANEAACWQYIQELRGINLRKLWREVRAGTKSGAIDRGSEVVRGIFSLLVEGGFSFDAASPSHALGHTVRDCVNALLLASRLAARPADTFIGFVGGVLHDIGCSVIPRFEESVRAVRHAEAGAILIEEMFRTEAAGLSRPEQLLIEYGVAAHTNYLAPMTVNCSDGAVRTTEPYRVEDDRGSPVIGVIFPRFADRLDLCGPAYVGKHYLGMVVPHEVYGSTQFYSTEFASYMLPTLSPPGGNYTMLMHMNLFATTQNSRSPHTKYDYGEMIRLRNANNRRLKRIIRAVTDSSVIVDVERTEQLWTDFLRDNVEPSPVGRSAAEKLSAAFGRLPYETRRAWCRGFDATMREYTAWATEVTSALSTMPVERMRTVPMVQSVLDVVKPARSWSIAY